MFAELEPLLADRTLVLTISCIGKDLVRVNVIPKCLKENDATEKAMATPLSITGSAAELDQQLAAQLTGYTAALLRTGSTLQQVQEAHQAALKEIEAENKKTLDSKRKASSVKAASKPDDKSGTSAKEGKPVFAAKPDKAPGASLFDDLPPIEPSDEARSSDS